jgi:BON domain
MIFKPYDYLVVAYLLLAPFVLISVTWAIERNKEKRVSRLRFKDDLPDVPADSEQLGRAWFLKSRRMWFVVVCYELLTTAGIALFYFSPRVVASRVRRDLANSGFSQPIDIHISGGVATLTGQVATPHLATALSRRTAEIVGPNHVINRLQVEGPEILGSLVEPLGEAQVVVDTSYDDSPQSLREIGAILNLPQYETIQVGRGTRMPGLIAKRFRIVRSRLPKSYSMLAAGISTLNRLERPADLRPGTLKLPILPPRYAVQDYVWAAVDRGRSLGLSISSALSTA